MVAYSNEGFGTVDTSSILLFIVITSNLLIKQFCCYFVCDSCVKGFTTVIKGAILNTLGYTNSELNVMLSWCIYIILRSFHFLLNKLLFVLFASYHNLSFIVEKCVILHVSKSESNFDVS